MLIMFLSRLWEVPCQHRGSTNTDVVRGGISKVAVVGSNEDFRTLLSYDTACTIFFSPQQNKHE